MIAVIGDTQRTLPVERLFLRREQNDVEAALLIADLIAPEPSMLVHLGDMVARGSSARDWSAFDRLMAPVRNVGIPILPILGNHDLWGNAGRGARARYARFPWLAEQSWYTRSHGRLRLIWLDTNAGRLSSGKWAEQARWFEAQLANADHDVNEAGVVVFGHHPPFTNSRATGDAMDVQQAFVDAFCACRKTLAFISGHTHAYERFVERGKTFIVSGGGGGPRPGLLHGAACRHADLFTDPSPRPFHYLMLHELDDGVRLIVRGINKGDTIVRELERLDLTATFR